MVKSPNPAESAEPSEMLPLTCRVCHKPQHTMSKVLSVIAKPCMDVYCYECAASREFHGDVPNPNCPICDKKVEKILVVRGQLKSDAAAASLFASKELLALHFAERIYYDESWDADKEMTEQDDMDYENVLEKFLKMSYFSCSGCTEKSFERNLKLLKYDQVTLDYVSRHRKEGHGNNLCRLCFYNLKPLSICQDQVLEWELLDLDQTGTQHVTGPRRSAHTKCELCKPDGDKFSPAWLAQLHWDQKAHVHHLAEHHVQCDLCTEYLTDKDKFEEHLKLIHLVCPKCHFKSDEPQVYDSLAELEDHCNTDHGVKIGDDEMVAKKFAARAKDGSLVSKVVAHVESQPRSDASAEVNDNKEGDEDFVFLYNVLDEVVPPGLPAPLQPTQPIEKRLQSLAIADQQPTTSTAATAPPKKTLANLAAGGAKVMSNDASAYPTLAQAADRSSITNRPNDGGAWVPSNPNKNNLNNNRPQRDGCNNNLGFANGYCNLANGTGVGRGGNNSGTENDLVDDDDNDFYMVN